jgi:hypothetical protein
MKKYIYITGMLILCVLLAASFFKVNHLPGANPLILAGLGGIALIFLPLGYFRLLKSTDDKLLRFVYSAAFISFLIDFVGAAFKILHWPGAGILLIIGVPLPFVLFLPAYIKYHNKRKLKADIHFFTIVLFMVYLGVFSSLLAIDVSRNVVDAYAHAANNLTETNEFLEKNTSISPKAKELIEHLEQLKKEVVLIGDARSGKKIETNGVVDYQNVSRKSTKIPPKEMYTLGLAEFNLQFDNYCQTINMTDTNKRFVDEINKYRLGKDSSTPPVIVQLPLVGILDILTDWQNKILLMNIPKLYNKNILIHNPKLMELML